jgi:hypothetical protein
MTHLALQSADVFNLCFTMHGTAMIFLVAMPLIFGFAHYLVPLMIGTSAFSYKRGPRIITGWNSQLTGKSQGSHRRTDCSRNGEIETS